MTDRNLAHSIRDDAYTADGPPPGLQVLAVPLTDPVPAVAHYAMFPDAELGWATVPISSSTAAALTAPPPTEEPVTGPPPEPPPNGRPPPSTPPLAEQLTADTFTWT